MDMGALSVDLLDTASMTQYFYGLVTGLVIETGYEGTFIVPIHNSVPVREAIQQVKIAGLDITS